MVISSISSGMAEYDEDAVTDLISRIQVGAPTNRRPIAAQSGSKPPNLRSSTN